VRGREKRGKGECCASKRSFLSAVFLSGLRARLAGIEENESERKEAYAGERKGEEGTNMLNFESALCSDSTSPLELKLLSSLLFLPLQADNIDKLIYRRFLHR